MNLGWFGVAPLGGSNGLGRLKPGLRAVRGSWSQCAASKSWGLTHELACSAGFPACGFTGLSSPVDQERATGKSPEPAGSKACATNPPRFMVPMHAQKRKEATHEPWLVWSPAFRRLERLGPAEAGTPSCQRFIVPMRGIKVVEATHEPERRAPARRGDTCSERAHLELRAPCR